MKATTIHCVRTLLLTFLCVVYRDEDLFGRKKCVVWSRFCNDLISYAMSAWFYTLVGNIRKGRLEGYPRNLFIDRARSHITKQNVYLLLNVCMLIDYYISVALFQAKNKIHLLNTLMENTETNSLLWFLFFFHYHRFFFPVFANSKTNHINNIDLN